MLNILRRIPAKKKPYGRSAGRSFEPRKRDALTGAVSKSVFQEMVESALTGGKENGCLLLVDVDCMREINEKFGAETGDKVLQSVFAVLRENFRAGDCIGRLGEDSFGIWIEGISADQVSGIRRRIVIVNDKLLHNGDGLPKVTLSAGAALGEAGGNYKELYRQAQKVLYRVKEGGRCGCEIFTDRKTDYNASDRRID